MTVINNVENKIVILHKLSCKEVKSYNMKPKEQIVGIIDVDFSLIRHIGKATEINEVSINNCGYPTIKRKDNTTTTFSRFILEFYSKEDSKLKQILQNKEYEVNHKNRNKLDNRVENLEVVTHQENVKHSKGTSYDVLYSTEQLKLLQERCKKDKKQNIDEEYLKRISGLFYKAVTTSTIEDNLVKCCYLKFNYNKMNLNNKTLDSIFLNNFIDFKQYKLMTNFHTIFIKELLRKKKRYIYEIIVENNIRLLNRYILKYPNIEKILKKYKLIDNDFKDKLKFDKSNTRNLLLDFYNDIYNTNRYTIENGNILLTISIKDFFNTRGKHKAFLVLYLLGLLTRQNDISKPNIVSNRRVHTPSFIHIPVYTDELLKRVNERAKDLLHLNLNRFTYFLIREEFGEEVADSIYKNKQCKAKYIFGLRAKNDILNFLKTDKDIYSQGFMTKQEIFEQIEAINTQRMIKDEPHNKIYNNFINFISGLLLYNTETKRVLEDLGLAYVSLNSKTIQNIQKYQGSFSTDLKPKMKVIVLKKLLK